jgi:SpoVK/Ycf46/Vps4 family AAA+-type ATPase
MTSFKDDLAVYVKARYPILYLVSFEESRVTAMVNAICAEQKKALILWTATTGFTSPAGKVLSQGASDLTEAIAQIMEEAKAGQKKAIYLFRDLHRWIGEAQDRTYYRLLRDAVEVLKSSSSTIILVSPVLAYPRELEKDIVVLDVPLPDRAELKIVLDGFIQATKAVKADIQVPTPEEEDMILRSGAGFTAQEFENVIARSMVMHKRIDPVMVVQEKEQTIRKSGLDYYQSLENLGDIGGLGNLKEWIIRRSLAFTEKARAFGLRPPKFVFLCGCSGTGKTLSAKAMASYLQMPLIIVDPSKLMGAYVGQSEAQTRAVFKTAEAIAPVVLMFDEAEKILPQGGASAGDSGVSSRLFGMLLTFIQETRRPVLIVMTANNPLLLPVELYNRADAVFFVDLPTKAEREEVFEVQIRKVGRDPRNFSLAQLAEASEGWSGREIEKIIAEALVRSFEAGHELDTETIIGVLKERLPLSVMRREDTERARKWGKEYAIPASKSVVRTQDEGRAVELS